MVDKSNEYGYVPSSPTQARGSNTGIFEVNDVTDLLAAGQWSGDFGKLELIETKTISSASSAIFPSIQESTYNVHFLTINDCQVSTDNTALVMRFFENGVEETAAVYQRAQFIIDSSGANADFRSTADTALYNIWNIGNATGESGNCYIYLYNLGDSSKYSFVTGQEIHISSVPYARTSFGSGVLPQASTVDQIKLFPVAGTFSATASLYGIAES
jgi:hypothetical protein